ncbi:nuclear transcription factor Y subunit gamma-like [Uloborus diversus]|uniref:nuclear transcription factor Y subunit gamma-like n=1 Tax=Uloborus diversus TaxID=327109 RepID=UPI002409BF97|nr:nuclear transcription factor Y subunit gamma-like [Uloborus diversus]XP_054712325.1 nuclear transcription factor Y subunit gamma-like [Uloborus diversus]
MSQPENFSQSSNTSHGNNEAQQVLDIFWEREMEEIRNLGNNDFKNQELPLARIKKIMKLDEDVKMISAEAPVLFAKAAEIFITELSLRAWVHTEDNKRRTLQRNDIAMAITKYDQFDFLIDIVPREELKPSKRQEEGVRTAAMHPDQVQYYFQLAQQHQAALQQQQTSPAQPQQGQQLQQAQPQQIQLVPANATVQQVASNTQAISVQTASPTFSVPPVLQVQAVSAEATQQQAQAAAQVQVQQVQVQNAQQPASQQVLQLQQPMAGQVNQAGGGIQIVQQIINQNGEIQQIPFQLNQNQLQLLRMQMQGQNTNQPIIIHAAPVQQGQPTQAPQGAVFQQANQHLTQQQQTQTVYQIQQVAQAPGGQVATTATPVFLTQAPGGGTATVQIQAVSAEQTTTDEDQQQQT